MLYKYNSAWVRSSSKYKHRRRTPFDQNAYIYHEQLDALVSTNHVHLSQATRDTNLVQTCINTRSGSARGEKSVLRVPNVIDTEIPLPRDVCAASHQTQYERRHTPPARMRHHICNAPCGATNKIVLKSVLCADDSTKGHRDTHPCAAYIIYLVAKYTLTSQTFTHTSTQLLRTLVAGC